MRSSGFRWRLAAALGLMLLISALSSIPLDGIKRGVKEIPGYSSARQEAKRHFSGLRYSEIHNLMHVPFFAVLAWLWMRVLTPRYGVTRAVFLTVAIIFVFGIIDELRQIPVEGRDASVSDIGLDLTGGMFGLLIYGFFYFKETASRR